MLRFPPKLYCPYMGCIPRDTNIVFQRRNSFLFSFHPKRNIISQLNADLSSINKNKKKYTSEDIQDASCETLNFYLLLNNYLTNCATLHDVAALYLSCWRDGRTWEHGYITTDPAPTFVCLCLFCLCFLFL